MLISVVTPVLNGAKTIERTLQSLSVQRADFEHIVMDGGSTDDTESIVRRYEDKYPVKWFSQPDKSVFDGMWNGMSHAQGDVMGTIFADDFYMPWTLATVRAIFESNPDVQWITGIPSWYFEDRLVSMTASLAPVFPQWAIRRGLASTRLLGFPQQESIFWRRSLWEKAAPHDLLTTYRYAADYHLWRRFAQHTSLRTVSTVLACFTISDNQISWKFRSKYLDECGIHSGDYSTSVPKRILSRIISNLHWGQVLKATSRVR